MRIGEALALEWRDIDRDAGTLRIERAYKRSTIGTRKGNRHRSVAVDSLVLGALNDHRKAQLAAGQRSGVIRARPSPAATKQ